MKILKRILNRCFEFLTEDQVEVKKIDEATRNKIIEALKDLEQRVDLRDRQREMLNKISGLKVDERLIDDVLLSNYDLDSLKLLLDIVD